MGEFRFKTTPLRSKMMSAIRGSGNRSTELRLAKVMRQYGITGWRRNRKNLPGTPDFAFNQARVAIFVDGCFWHGCPKCYRSPKKHPAFWRSKVARNIARDKRVTLQLKRRGWQVIRVWEHSLLNPAMTAMRVSRALTVKRATLPS